jgi:hypothetical protein
MGFDKLNYRGGSGRFESEWKPQTCRDRTVAELFDRAHYGFRLSLRFRMLILPLSGPKPLPDFDLNPLFPCSCFSSRETFVIGRRKRASVERKAK